MCIQDILTEQSKPSLALWEFENKSLPEPLVEKEFQGMDRIDLDNISFFNPLTEK